MHIERTAAELHRKVLEDLPYLHFGRLEPLSKGISALDILNEVVLTASKTFQAFLPNSPSTCMTSALLSSIDQQLGSMRHMNLDTICTT